jgi:hypothetical protein
VARLSVWSVLVHVLSPLSPAKVLVKLHLSPHHILVPVSLPPSAQPITLKLTGVKARPSINQNIRDVKMGHAALQAFPCRLRRRLLLTLGYLHPVACVRSGDGFFYPSTQRHYRRLIYILLHVSVVRPSSSRKYINS